MKIAIDISQIPYGTGVSIYTKELVKALLKIDSKNTYTFYAGALKRKKEILSFYYKIKQKNTNLVLYPIPPTLADILFNRLNMFYIEEIIGRIDVFHASDWAVPKSSAPMVSTIHDLSPFLHPESADNKVKSVHKRVLKRIKKYKNLVIVPSEATKNDAINLGVKKDLTYIIPEALSLDKSKPQKHDIKITKQRYNLSKKFALMVGTAPRKNISRSIKAFHNTKNASKLEKLVIVGNKPENYKKHKDVIFTGYVSDSTLSSLYASADVFLYPSLYEGFGLPILEAFSHGCPVVTSNLSSMPEVAGEAAILVNPNKTKEIEKGILEALKNSKSLNNKGKKRLKMYNWQETAKETLKIYERAFNSNRRK